MLGGRYVGDVQRDIYGRAALPLFSSIIMVGVGVRRSFADRPQVATGYNVPLHGPLTAAGRTYDRVFLRVHNFDPTLAPEGCTVISATLEADEPYWSWLRETDRDQYEAEQRLSAEAVVRTLDRRYPGLAAEVEMTDVSTTACPSVQRRSEARRGCGRRAARLPIVAVSGRRHEMLSVLATAGPGWGPLSR